MGLFSIHHFTDAGFSEDEAVNIVKVCNSILMSDSTIVTGTKFENGTLDSFSSEKRDIHTHVAMLIGMSELGGLPKDHLLVEPMKQPTAEERARSAEARANRLKNQASRVTNG